VEKGESCIQCGRPLDVYRAAEVGHIFKLGTKYSQSMKAMVLTADGKETPIVMGSYGIGVERIMTSAIELFHDADGIIWPLSIAPFHVIITPVEYKEDMKAAADSLYGQMRSARIEVLLDDRSERPGVKFKDADLIGIPYRVVIGPKRLKEGKVELFTRATKKTDLIPLDAIVPRLQSLIGEK